MRNPTFPHLCWHIFHIFALFSFFKNYSHSSRYEVVSCGFGLYFLMTKRCWSLVRYLFIWSLDMCINFGEVTLQVLFPFLNCIVSFLSCKNSLYILGPKCFSDMICILPPILLLIYSSHLFANACEYTHFSQSSEK